MGEDKEIESVFSIISKEINRRIQAKEKIYYLERKENNNNEVVFFEIYRASHEPPNTLMENQDKIYIMPVNNEGGLCYSIENHMLFLHHIKILEMKEDCRYNVISFKDEVFNYVMNHPDFRGRP